MNRSTDRFLTTHTGSLPRPDDLIRAMFAKEEGVPVDAAALAEHVGRAVDGVVQKQAEAGIDIVDDGEMSKPSYATYIKDRLSGFGGEGNTFVYQDLSEFPRLARRVFGDPGRSRRKTPACNGPISVAEPGAVKADIEHLKAAVAKVDVKGAFMTAASPGVVTLFFRNEHYPTEEAYIAAIADAMRYEYEAITNAGITLQIDCPDLGMGRHIQHAELSLPEWRKKAELHVEERLGVGVGAARVVEADALAGGERDLAERHPDRRIGSGEIDLHGRRWHCRPPFAGITQFRFVAVGSVRAALSARTSELPRGNGWLNATSKAPGRQGGRRRGRAARITPTGRAAGIGRERARRSR